MMTEGLFHVRCGAKSYSEERSSLGGKFATSLGREVNLMIET